MKEIKSLIQVRKFLCVPHYLSGEEKMITCPFCNSTHPYEVDGNEYSRIIGIEVWGVYDGVLYWLCPDTHKAFPRDFKFDALRELSKLEAEKRNSSKED